MSRGPLKYGSDADSVVFAVPLTSLPTTADIPSAAVTDKGANEVYDPVLGFKAVDGGIYINTLTDALLIETGFQLSFEIQKEWLCAGNTTVSGSEGATLSGVQTVMAMRDAGANVTQILQKGVFNALTFKGLHDGEWTGYWTRAGVSAPSVNTVGKSDYITVVIASSGGLNGGKTLIVIDGLPYLYADTNLASWVQALNRLWIGSDRSIQRYMTDHYIRNLQLAAEPITYPVNRRYRRIYHWGDSLTRTVNPGLKENWDVTTGLTILRELHNNGIYVGDFYNQAYGGHTINDTANDAQMPGAMETYRAEMLATNPQIVIVGMGTNDCATPAFDPEVDADIRTDLRDHITTISDHPSVEVIIVRNVPSMNGSSVYHNDSTRAKIDYVNSEIAALKDWYTGNKILIFVDVFTHLGGHDQPDNYTLGGLSGAFDDLHQAGEGQYQMAFPIVEALLSPKVLQR